MAVSMLCYEKTTFSPFTVDNPQYSLISFSLSVKPSLRATVFHSTRSSTLSSAGNRLNPATAASTLTPLRRSVAFKHSLLRRQQSYSSVRVFFSLLSSAIRSDLHYQISDPGSIQFNTRRSIFFISIIKQKKCLV